MIPPNVCATRIIRIHLNLVNYTKDSRDVFYRKIKIKNGQEYDSWETREASSPIQDSIKRNFKLGIASPENRLSLISRSQYLCNVFQCIELRTLIHLCFATKPRRSFPIFGFGIIHKSIDDLYKIIAIKKSRYFVYKWKIEAQNLVICRDSLTLSSDLLEYLLNVMQTQNTLLRWWYLYPNIVSKWPDETGYPNFLHSNKCILCNFRFCALPTSPRCLLIYFFV